MDTIRNLQAERTETLWYQNVTLDQAESYISENLRAAARNVIAIGYYLKCIRDNRLYEEAGYHNIWDYARERYGFSMSTASRYMSRNDKFSKGGNSPILDERYREYSKSQLQEMLSLDEEQLKQVTPDMTAREIRDMKKPKKIPYYDIPRQEEMLDIPGVVPEQTGQAVLKASDFVEEESIATSQQNAEHDDCLERGAEPGQQEIPDAAEMQENEEKRCENSSEPKWNTENEYDVRRKYCNAAARKLIHAYHDWMLEDFENRVMDVTASEEEYKQNFRKTGCSWYFSDPDAGVAHVNLFDDYVQFWSGTGDWIGDCRWFYLCTAVQTMWNEIALEQAKQSQETEESEESETEEIIDAEFEEEEESVSDLELLKDLLDGKKSLLETNLKIPGIEPDDIHIRRQKLEVAALEFYLKELWRREDEED